MPDEDNVPASLRLAASLSWRFLVVASAIVVVAFATAKLEIIVVPASAALLLSTQLVPPSRWLRNHGWPHAIATVAVLLGGFALVVAASIAVVPAVAAQRGALTAGLQTGVAETSDWLSTGPLRLPREVVQRSIDRVGTELTTNTGTIVGGIFTGATALLNLVIGALLTMFLLFFLLHDGDEIWQWIVRLFPEKHKPAVRAIGSRAWEALTGYVRGAAMVGCVEAIVLGITLRIIGMPLVLPLAVITFFGAYVPVAGLGLAGVLAAFVAFVSKGPVAALVVAVIVTVIGQLESPVLRPVLGGRSMSLHPVAVLLTVGAGALVWGIAGAFLALPLSLLVIVAARELLGNSSAEG